MNPTFADLPTTIYEVMSRLARETNAVNLGQGFHGLAAIPVGAFDGEGGLRNVLRFRFAKRDATLDAALDRLSGPVRTRLEAPSRSAEPRLMGSEDLPQTTR